MRKANKIFRIVVIFMGAILFIMIGVQEILARSQVGGGLNFNEMTESDFKSGIYVKGDIEYCFGKFAEEETTETTLFVFKNSRVSQHYYILPLTQFGDDLKYVAIACKSQADMDKLESLTNETVEYMSNQDADEPTPIPEYQGKITAMEDDLKNLMVEYFQEAELYDDDKEIYQHIIPYTITYTNPKDSYIFIGIGGVFALIGIISIAIPAIRTASLNKRNKQNDLNI